MLIRLDDTQLASVTDIIDADFAVDSCSHPVIAYFDTDTGSLAVAGCELIFANGFE
jgi:hypothetical protein